MVIKPPTLTYGKIMISILGINERYIPCNDTVSIRGIVARILFQPLCTFRNFHSFFNSLH